jgi:hypothetical protein
MSLHKVQNKLPGLMYHAPLPELERENINEWEEAQGEFLIPYFQDFLGIVDGCK